MTVFGASPVFDPSGDESSPEVDMVGLTALVTVEDVSGTTVSDPVSAKGEL